MKLAYTIAALAFAGAVGGLGMTGTAHAQPAPQGRYCEHTPFGAEAGSCGYMHRRQCDEVAQVMGTWCSLNPKIAYRVQPYGYGMAAGY